MQEVQRAAAAMLEQIEGVIYGKTPTLKLVLAGLFAGGHLLLEDVPGTAKTLLAKALAKSVGGKFRRVQGTPDLLPGDVTGSSIYNPAKGSFRFQPGPVFANILLVDEINRATPRAQAALLECMAERQVSAEGRSFALEPPFFVIATQNPVDHEGTFPLPEAQLDRFLMRLSIGYPPFEAEVEMLARSAGDPLGTVKQVVEPKRLVALQEAVRRVHVADTVRSYVVQLVSATRKSEDLILGAGPRASKALYGSAQAWAAMDGRDHVLPDDVKRMIAPVLHHRVILGPEGRLSGKTSAQAVEASIRLVPAPSGNVRGR